LDIYSEVKLPGMFLTNKVGILNVLQTNLVYSPNVF